MEYIDIVSIGVNIKTIAEEQRNTRTKRSGCPKKNDILSITSVFLEHGNHSRDPLTNKFAISHRTLTEPMLEDIKFWTTNGDISMRTQQQLLFAKYENVFFLPQDLTNAIQKFKKERQIENEAATLINHLLECKAEDIRWIVKWRVDSATNSLVSLFWMTPEQYDLYVKYRDVIQYDNTYSTNQFKMALGLFVIVDNNNRSHLVRQTLMNDETLESFEWVFTTLLEAVNFPPSVIITDNDLASDTAIANIMPGTYHIHCIYHIGQNLLKNLKARLGSQYNEFSNAWYQMRNAPSQAEFDCLWDSLLEQYPDSVSYLNRALGSQKQR
ncbi:9412_t:CDS:2 [Ambispora gerdemannii]|uniref:9412_t:CDS:1 n=1 Tax=Ambispora gerdemannii TaxID=144530 RepID=A0A9N8YYV4_9GLOM|nr:9412_t:CDS:2 [Ambispora gerdemannii]